MLSSNPSSSSLPNTLSNNIFNVPYYNLYDREQLFDHFSSITSISSGGSSNGEENNSSTSSDSDLFIQASVEQLSRILRKCYGVGTDSMKTQINPPKNQMDGPMIIDYVLNNLIFRNINNCTLVHLAARYNKTFVLNWLLSCCCDEQCDHSSGTHSKECLHRQDLLWSTVDKNLATPLFYACMASKTFSEDNIEIPAGHTSHPLHDSIVFLLSQKTVQSKQLNHHVDAQGNLPVVIVLRRRDYILADLLLFFGANLNVTVGLGIGASESILHSACRDRDMKLVKYVGQHSNKVILKRNQREENCLFSCLRDFRSNQFQTSARLNSNLSMHADFLKEILCNSSSTFGTENFEKALIMKNSFGRNLLLESVALNDHDSMKTICQYLSNYQQQPDRLNISGSNLVQISPSESSDSGLDTLQTTINLSLNQSISSSQSLSPTMNTGVRSKSLRGSSSFLESVVFDTDKNGNSILHIISQSVIKASEALEDFMWLFDGMKWLLSWLTINFKPSALDISPLSSTPQSNSPTLLSSFALLQKNSDGLSVYEMVSLAKQTDKTEWALSVVSEKLRKSIKKWRKMDSCVYYNTNSEDEEEEDTSSDSASNGVSSQSSGSYPASAASMTSSTQIFTEPTTTSTNNQPSKRLGFLSKFGLGKKNK